MAAAQEERFTRKKHDASFPSHAVAYCLREAGITPSELDLVGFYEKPLVKFDRLLETYAACAPRGWRSFLMAMPLWLSEKLWMADDIREQLEGYEGEVLLRRAPRVARGVRLLPVAVRGGGDPHDGRRRRMGDLVDRRRPRRATSRCSSELRFPHSLGLLYSAFTYFTGLQGQLRRVQGDGARAVRRAEVRQADQGPSDRDPRRRQPVDEHGVLHVPPRR